jgi:hypothetical protein
MQTKFNLNIKNKIIYLILYITLIIGFIFHEDSIGGAEYDWNIIFEAIKSFSINFDETFKNYYQFSIAHYPFYYIFVSQVYKISNSIFVTKIIIFHLNLILPFIFFQIIKIKFNFKNNYLIYLPGIFFLSPSYRSSAVWTLNDNVALIFFSLSILFYLKSLNANSNKKTLIYITFNVIALVISAYIRQYYAIFSIFFFYKFIEKYNFKIITYYVILNLIFASYAIKSTFFNTNLNYSFNFFTMNLFNNIALSITIFIIYLIPIILNKYFFTKTYYYYYEHKFMFILIFLLSIIICFFFNYKLEYGGGIIYKIFYKLNPYLYFIILILSTFLLFNFLLSNFKNNVFLIICLFLAFPTIAIYQKYFDPLSLILIFSLFENLYIKKFVKNLRYNIKYLYLYFASIYAGSLIYNILFKL